MVDAAPLVVRSVVERGDVLELCVFVGRTELSIGIDRGFLLPLLSKRDYGRIAVRFFIVDAECMIVGGAHSLHDPQLLLGCRRAENVDFDSSKFPDIPGGAIAPLFWVHLALNEIQGIAGLPRDLVAVSSQPVEFW